MIIVLFAMDKGLLRKGIKNCTDILESTQKVRNNFELTEVRMLGMVDKGRRMRRVYLESQEVMSSVGDTTLPLEYMVNRVQGLYDTVNAADEYATSIVDCIKIPEISIGKGTGEVENTDGEVKCSTEDVKLKIEGD